MVGTTNSDHLDLPFRYHVLKRLSLHLCVYTERPLNRHTQLKPGCLICFYLLFFAHALGRTWGHLLRLPGPLACGQSPRKADWSWGGREEVGVLP